MSNVETNSWKTDNQLGQLVTSLCIKEQKVWRGLGPLRGPASAPQMATIFRPCQHYRGTLLDIVYCFLDLWHTEKNGSVTKQRGCELQLNSDISGKPLDALKYSSLFSPFSHTWTDVEIRGDATQREACPCSCHRIKNEHLSFCTVTC